MAAEAARAARKRKTAILSESNELKEEVQESSELKLKKSPPSCKAFIPYE
jgi:hypothetical protein